MTRARVACGAARESLAHRVNSCASGKPLATLHVSEKEYGYGLGIAFDACGNLEWADLEHTTVLDPLQPTLRRIAR